MRPKENSPSKIFVILDQCLEYFLYLYLVFMFLTKGEGVRNILIFGGGALWLVTLKHRGFRFFREPETILYGVFLFTILLSAIFSIDPAYSLAELKGDPIKAALLFPMFATVMSDKKRLLRLTYVCSLMAVVMVTIGYYSYIFHDIDMLKPDTPLMHAWHNKFARYLNTFHPFLFVLFFISKKRSMKVLIAGSLVYTVVALILSTSRGGYIGFFAIVLMWLLYLSKQRGYNLGKAIAIFMITVFLLGAASWKVSPFLRERIINTVSDIKSFNNRTLAWIPAMHAIKERPLMGWGYGNRIFQQNEPYESTQYKPPPIGTHNTFLRVLFHQGIIGLLPYLFLILYSIRSFYRAAGADTGIRNYVLVAISSVLVGNYILNALVADFRLKHFAVVLGIGMAAKVLDEDSDT